MTSPRRRALLVILVGLALLAFNLRAVVASFSPIVAAISKDIPLDSFTIGLIGSITPFAFGIGGVLAPSFVRRWGLVTTTVIVLTLMVVGHFLRSLATGAVVLIAGTCVALLAAAVGNILVAGIVKQYFPSRTGSVTMMTVALMSIGATVPSLAAVPISDATTWRISLGAWGATSLLALIPWVMQALARRPAGDARAAAVHVAAAVRVTRSPMAWAMVGIFAIGSVAAYTAFAWFPTMLVEHAGYTFAEAGVLVSIFALGGLALAIVPVLVARNPRLVRPVIAISLSGYAGGLLGLWFAPQFAPLWMVMFSIVTTSLPLTLTLVNLRTRTQGAAVALSGFVQGTGYLLSAVYPLLVGIIHQATATWSVVFVVLLATLLAGIPALVVFRRSRFLEDELGHRIPPGA